MKIIGVVILLFILGGLGAYLANYLGLLNSPIVPGEIRQLTSQSVSIQNQINQNLTPVAFRPEVVVQNLNVPWSMVFTSNERILVAERPGRIRLVENGELRAEPMATFSEVPSRDEDGLMGMVLDPDYTENKYIYVCYTYAQNGALVDAVERLIDEGSTLRRDTKIIDQIPAAYFHAGCELGFGPDGKLYITTGDATDRELAQDTSSLAGKILRINSDGSMPSDNPTQNSPIYSLGHRNPQGIDWHPETGELYSTEHGPSGNDGPGGGDEINLIKAGENYGWPLVSHDRSRDGLVSPLTTFTPAEAPASLLIYSGTVFPQLKNNLLIGALRGQGILRVQLDPNNSDTIVSVEKLNIELGRIREITESPDGLIYFTTSNTDGRGSPRTGDDKIYRLVPNN